MKKIIIIALFAFYGSVASINAQSTGTQPRTIVTTDGEIDDQDSFIRLLMYANEFHLEGLIYSSSQWHYKGDGKGNMFVSEMPGTAKRYGKRTNLRWPGTIWMQEFIDKYNLVYPNLIKHDKNYPTAAYLKSIVKTGNINFEGEMDKPTEGSDFIKKILLDNNPAPVYLQIWGGTNTVARALKSIEEQYKSTPQWESIYKKVSAKAILYTVLDQDATYKKYVAINWPDIRVMYNSAQFWSFAYFWPQVVPVELKTYLQGKWMAENIKFNHGPLMASYFLWGDGQKITGDPEHTQGDTAEAKKYHLGKYDFISEGDSPAFLYLVDVGLQSMDNAAYGGWGGRMIRSDNLHRWEDGKNVSDFNPYTQKNDESYPQTRWMPALQNDFAARANWCVNDYKNANHAPVVRLLTSNTMHAKPGTQLILKGTATDPDKDKVTYKWWQYKEAGSGNAVIDIKDADSPTVTFNIPKDAKEGETFHIILEAIDSGTPNLTRYRRVIVTVD